MGEKKYKDNSERAKAIREVWAHIGARYYGTGQAAAKDIKDAFTEVFEEEQHEPEQGQVWKNGNLFYMASRPTQSSGELFGIQLTGASAGMLQCEKFGTGNDVYCPDHRVAVVGPDDVLLQGAAADGLRTILAQYVGCRQALLQQNRFSRPHVRDFTFDVGDPIDEKLQLVVNALSKEKP